MTLRRVPLVSVLSCIVALSLAKRPTPKEHDHDHKHTVEAVVSSDGVVAQDSHNDYSACENIVIGGGWSGTYFAWRAAVDPASTRIFDPKRTCLFEGLGRIGGRAYSHGDIKGLNDSSIKIDLGAYRFDLYQSAFLGVGGPHPRVVDLSPIPVPILNHVFNEVLNASLVGDMSCYDPVACSPGLGELVIAGPKYGYASGPQGLATLFQESGGRVFLHHRLINISVSTHAAKNITLTFNVTSGAVPRITTLPHAVSNVFLNMPKTAVQALEKGNALNSSLVDARAQYALNLPVQQEGAKQFLIYPSTWWRNFPELTYGLFRDSIIDAKQHLPPLNGRLHDFHGPCAHNATVDNATCPGAVLTFYSFSNESTAFYALFQKDTSEPFTYYDYPYTADANASMLTAVNTMISSAHHRFIQALTDIAASRNVTGFDASKVPYPTGTVMSVWWGRPYDYASALVPAVSSINVDRRFVGFNPDNAYSGGAIPPSQLAASDPLHAIRNRVSKPLDHYNIYLANEAYSGGEGWGHPALVMTERILWHFFKNKPSWMGSSSCRNSCLTAYHESKEHPNIDCAACASAVWWASEIASHPPKNSAPFKPVALPCSSTWTSADGDLPLTLSWTWPNASYISINYTLSGGQWVALGFGASMRAADIIMARNTGTASSSGPWIADQRRSFDHALPVPLAPSMVYATAKVVSVTPSSFDIGSDVTVSFTVPVDVPTPGGRSVSVDGPTDIIYAALNVLPDVAVPPMQHSRMMQSIVDFRCGRPPVSAIDTSCAAPPSFSKDIRPLFRYRDQQAMLFMFDLWSFADVKESFGEIYERIVDKTVHNLVTGMPPDITWSLDQIALFKRWNDTGCAP